MGIGMKKLIVSSVLAALLSGCSPSEDKILAVGTSEYAQALKDPDSAKFTDLYFKKDINQKGSGVNGYVCGMVNAKNSFGAYVGFHPFYIHVSVEPRFLIPIFGVAYGSSDPGSVNEDSKYFEYGYRCGDKQSK